MGGLGVAGVSVYDQTVLAASGTVTIPLPSPCTKLRIRIKSSGVNAATTIAIGNINLSDGTNTVQAGTAALATTAAGVNFDLNRELLTDIQAISISFVVTLAGATTTATISTEVYGNP